MPALQADAIWRGVQAPLSACCFTCCSVIPKQLHTYTRFTSRPGSTSRAVPMYRVTLLIGEANLTLPAAQVPQKWEGRGSYVIRAPLHMPVTSRSDYWSLYISATRNARSSDWLRLSRGSQAVS